MFARLSALPALLSFFWVQRTGRFTVPDEPMFDEPTLTRFRDLIGRARLYVEFGTGGSTLVADRLGVATVSVDNDRFFARAVRRRLSPATKVTVLDVSTGPTGPWGRPLLTKPTSGRLRSRMRYAFAPFERLGDRVPDLVLVDGRFRVGCALETIRRAAGAGCTVTLLFDDYAKSGRESYRRLERFAGRPERVGRSALFHIVPKQLARVPTLDDVRDALRDAN